MRYSKSAIGVVSVFALMSSMGASIAFAYSDVQGDNTTVSDSDWYKGADPLDATVFAKGKVTLTSYNITRTFTQADCPAGYTLIPGASQTKTQMYAATDPTNGLKWTQVETGDDPAIRGTPTTQNPIVYKKLSTNTKWLDNNPIELYTDPDDGTKYAVAVVMNQVVNISASKAIVTDTKKFRTMDPTISSPVDQGNSSAMGWARADAKDFIKVCKKDVQSSSSSSSSDSSSSDPNSSSSFFSSQSSSEASSSSSWSSSSDSSVSSAVSSSSMMSSSVSSSSAITSSSVMSSASSYSSWWSSSSI